LLGHAQQNLPPTLYFYFVEKNPFFKTISSALFGHASNEVAIALTYYCISTEAVQLSRTAVQGLELKSLNEEII
jgi:hypothetical protein